MTDTTEDTAGMSEAELARHSEKMAKKKHAREKIMATKRSISPGRVSISKLIGEPQWPQKPRRTPGDEA